MQQKDTPQNAVIAHGNVGQVVQQPQVLAGLA